MAANDKFVKDPKTGAVMNHADFSDYLVKRNKIRDSANIQTIMSDIVELKNMVRQLLDACKKE
jgi:hypothetical protein